MQIELFSDDEVMSGEELEQQKAKVFTAKQIYRSSGLRGQIKYYLSLNDKDNAYKVFDQAFRTFGFGIPKSYGFSAFYRGEGHINYYMDGVQKYISIDSKELFDVLLKNIS